jgi:hypothetical protein
LRQRAFCFTRIASKAQDPLLMKTRIAHTLQDDARNPLPPDFAKRKKEMAILPSPFPLAHTLPQVLAEKQIQITGEPRIWWHQRN